MALSCKAPVEADDALVLGKDTVTKMRSADRSRDESNRPCVATTNIDKNKASQAVKFNCERLKVVATFARNKSEMVSKT